MGKKILTGPNLLLALLLIGAFLVGACSSQGTGYTKYYDWMGTPIISGSQGTVVYTDWLNPYTAGRPDWDPYGPDSIFYPAADRAAWDPYAPVYGQDILKMEPADPVAEGLTIQGNLQAPNRLYLQRDGFLVTEGQVTLGEPYVLWANVGYFGSFVLYNNNEMALSQSYIRPGWYRITGLYPEILWSQRYRFTSAGLTSNVLQVLVVSGGYPTNYGLTGKVVDVSGRGMPGVKVLISGSDGGTFTTITNVQGYYGFDAPSGTYAIMAQLPGYSFTPSTARVWTGTISVAQIITGYAAGTNPPAVQTPAGIQGTQSTQSTQSMQSTQGIQSTQPAQLYSSGINTGYLTNDVGWVEGRIMDQIGTPISSAIIGVDGFVTNAASDSQGNYKIALSPGMHRVDAEKAGYGIPVRAVLVFSGQTSTLDLIGKRTATLGSGR